MRVRRIYVMETRFNEGSTYLYVMETRFNEGSTYLTLEITQ